MDDLFKHIKKSIDQIGDNKSRPNDWEKFELYRDSKDKVKPNNKLLFWSILGLIGLLLFANIYLLQYYQLYINIIAENYYTCSE